MKDTALVLTSLLALTLGAYNVHELRHRPPTATPQTAPGGEEEGAEVEIGDWMRPMQSHAVKLWLAGSESNWELAAFQLEEIEETLEEIEEHSDLSEEGVRLAPLATHVRSHLVEEVEEAIASKDHARFTATYDRLLVGCNDCHQATGHGFVSIVRPEGRDIFSGQRFTPPTTAKPATSEQALAR